MTAVAASVRRVPKSCRECGQEFTRQSANQRYCSDVCLAAVTTRQQHAKYRKSPAGKNRDAHRIRGPQSEEHKVKRAESVARTLAGQLRPCANPKCTEQFTPTQPAQKYCSGRCWVSLRRPSRWRDYKAIRLRVSPTDYKALLAEQGDACAICHRENRSNGRKDRLAVDHDHSTDVIRGLLCHRCNTALGLFNDSPNLLAVAIAYLGRAFVRAVEQKGA